MEIRDTTRFETLPGDVLDHKYRIEKQLGKGSMGAVFLATHLGTTRLVALKVVAPGLAAMDEFTLRFRREAEAAGRLRHPNVVNVTDFGLTTANGKDLAYLVMEYLDGQTLSDYMSANPRPQVGFIVDIVDQTALALDAAHAAGIVHRDLKPSNIWLESNQRGGYNVKVLDFGIAKMTHPAQPAEGESAAESETVVMQPRVAQEQATSVMTAFPMDLSLGSAALQTTAGTLLGTPAYMSPEQCLGQPVDHLADVYGLAVITYQMLCGLLPFEARNTQELVKMHLQSTPVSPCEHDRSVPESLAALVLDGLSKDPAKRPPSAGTFAARFRAMAEGELSILRKSKDTAHSYPNCFLPVQLFSFALAVPILIAARLGAIAAAQGKLAPPAVLLTLVDILYVAVVVFCFQLHKAGCAMVVKHAIAKGQFQPITGTVFRTFARGIPALLGSYLRSALDPRPSSFRDNVLWPVIWAHEETSGKPAILRSRQLCAAMPAAALSLTVRQYAIPLLSVLVFPISGFGSGATWSDLARVVISDSGFGWFFLLWPLLFTMAYMNYGPAFTFLYWSARHCRNESLEPMLPSAMRDDNRKKPKASLRPGTRFWILLPLILAAVATFLGIRSARPDSAGRFESARSDGRRGDVLRILDSGVPVDQRDSRGSTALMDAVAQGDAELVAALVAKGANVNARNRRSVTPLMLAAMYHRNDLARLLIDHGAAVNAADEDGSTPLILAAERGNAPLVALLLERGADVGHADGQAKTALTYAREEGYADVVALLERKQGA